MYADRKPTLAVVLWSAFAGLLTGCAPPPDAETATIRFAFQDRVGSAIPIVAVAKNYFAAHGLRVEPLRFNSGPACAEALYSGSADIGAMGDTTAVITTSRETPFIIVASHAAGEHRHRLIVRQDAPFEELADLRGRRVGIKKGTSTFGGFLAALDATGISPQAVDIVDLNPGTMPDALRAGSIDAFAASEPTPSIGELNGGRELTTFGGLGNQYPIMLLAHKDLLRDTSLMSRFFAALRDAEAFVRENRVDTIAVLADVTGLPSQTLERAMQRHTYRLALDADILASLKETAAYLRDQGHIAQIPDFSTRTTRSRVTRD